MIRIVHRKRHNITSHLMVWSKDALRIWLLSLEKHRQVTPLLWACSNLRRHKPLWIFHTFSSNTHIDTHTHPHKRFRDRISNRDITKPFQTGLWYWAKIEIYLTRKWFVASVDQYPKDNKPTPFIRLKDGSTFIFPFWAPVASRSVSWLKHIHNTALSIIMKLSLAWYFRS